MRGDEGHTPGRLGTVGSGGQTIAAVIAAEGGRVTFARFMQVALTHPTLGYYSRVGRLLRHGGDFSTAPALSPFFGKTVARLVTELVDASMAARPGADSPPTGKGPSGACVVELGGGEGHLAQVVLRHWADERPEWRDKVAYRTVEVGARLREIQAGAVSVPMAAGWDVAWGADLQEVCRHARPVVMVGNEFLDTVPVHLVNVQGSAIREVYVTVQAPDLVETWGDLSEEAAAEIELLFGTLDPGSLRAFTDDGIIEVFPDMGRLVRSAAQCMPSGSFVSVDYGEWFSGRLPAGRPWGLEGRARRRRSVRGYFKHQMTTDPLARPGRQDLTADVDFSAVDLHGGRNGLETVLFTTLAAFLRGGGAERELADLRSQMVTGSGDALEADRQATVLTNLLDERDLGGAFKVMVQVRDGSIADHVMVDNGTEGDNRGEPSQGGPGA